jgi:hypothetical protein
MLPPAVTETSPRAGRQPPRMAGGVLIFPVLGGVEEAVIVIKETL